MDRTRMQDKPGVAATLLLLIIREGKSHVYM